MGSPKKLKVFVSGKITGDKNYKQKFQKACKVLKIQGYQPVSPIEEKLEKRVHKKQGLFSNEAWGIFMRESIKKLLKCDAVCMLDDWEDSRGARLEYGLAVGLGLQVFFIKDGEFKGGIGEKTRLDSINEKLVRSQIVKKELGLYRDKPTMWVVRMLRNKYPLLFPTKVCARGLVRYYRGLFGERELSALADTSFLSKEKLKIKRELLKKKKEGK